MTLRRFVLICALATLLLYGLSAVASSAVYRMLGLDRQLDTGSFASDVFFGVQGASAVVYNRAPLAQDGPQIILVGASNMQHLRATEIAAEAPGVAVSNIAVSGSDLADFSLAVDLAYQAFPAQSHGTRLFVVGLWYGEFLAVQDQAEGALDAELTRYGLYHKLSDNRAAAVLAPPLTSLAMLALRPFVLGQRAWGTLKAVAASSAMRLLGENSPSAVDTLAADQTNLDESAKRAAIALRSSTGDRVTDEALAALTPIADRIADAGDRLMLVDLPIPQWHAAAVAAYADYRRRSQPYFSALLRRPGIYYLDLQGSLSDEDFYDSVHPKPSAGARLAHRLGRALAELPNLQKQVRAR